MIFNEHQKTKLSFFDTPSVSCLVSHHVLLMGYLAEVAPAQVFGSCRYPCFLSEFRKIRFVNRIRANPSYCNQDMKKTGY